MSVEGPERDALSEVAAPGAAHPWMPVAGLAIPRPAAAAMEMALLADDACAHVPESSAADAATDLRDRRQGAHGPRR
jgi:hypothetical protein